MRAQPNDPTYQESKIFYKTKQNKKKSLQRRYLEKQNLGASRTAMVTHCGICLLWGLDVKQVCGHTLAKAEQRRNTAKVGPHLVIGYASSQLPRVTEHTWVLWHPYCSQPPMHTSVPTASQSRSSVVWKLWLMAAVQHQNRGWHSVGFALENIKSQTLEQFLL